MASKTTTIRVTLETKNKLERIACILGTSIMEAVDFAVNAAEEKLEKYHGDLNILAEVLKDTRGSGYRNTSLKVNEVIAEALSRERGKNRKNTEG